MPSSKDNNKIQKVSDKFSSLVTDEEVALQKTHARLTNSIDLLSATVQNQGDFIESQKQAIKDALSKRLMTEVGLGVFAAKTIKVVNEELERHLSKENIIEPFENAISQNRDELSEIIESTKNNIISLTNKAKVHVLDIIKTIIEENKELSTQLELKNNELSKANEQIVNLQKELEAKENMYSIVSKEKLELNNKIKTLESEIAKLSQKNIQLMTSLEQTKQELKESQKLIESMGAGEIKDALQKEIKKNEELQDELTKLKSQFDTLKSEHETLTEKHKELENNLNVAKLEIQAKSEKIQELEKENKTQLERIHQLKQEVQDFQERWNRLYNLAEHELNFRIYFMIEDKGGDWVSLDQIGKALGIPRARVITLVKQFADSGLVELSGNKARAIKFIRPEGSFV